MKIFVLEKYSPEDDYDEDRQVDRLTVLNVFSTRELAQAWLEDYIREEWQIEDSSSQIKNSNPNLLRN